MQAATLIRDLATTGHADEKPILATIHSVFMVNADNVPSIYGGLNNLQLGLTELLKLLGSQKEDRDIDTSRYLFSMMHLERKLNKNPAMLQTIRERLDQAITQKDYFNDEMHSNVIGSLADIYVETLGTFQFRIQVMGNPDYLNNPSYLNKIRALLLAGVRSAILWQQVGGNRWQILFGRKRLFEAGQYLLKKIKASSPTPPPAVPPTDSDLPSNDNDNEAAP